MKEREVKQWITVNGQHVPIFEGQSKADAVKVAIAKQTNADADKKEKQIAANKKEAEKLNSASSKSEPKGFRNRAEEYVAGGVDIDKEFTKEDIEFIKKNSKEHDKPLYRVEDEKYKYKKFIDEGEIDGLGGTFRSFTTDKSFIERSVDEDSDDWAGISKPVVYEVLGKKKSFDMDPYTQGYNKHVGSQHEHLLGGEFEPIKERIEVIGGKKIRIVTLRCYE